MSDDDLEKLAAAMRDFKPSDTARERGMEAALSAFNSEFAPEIEAHRQGAVRNDEISEDFLSSDQGLTAEARPTDNTPELAGSDNRKDVSLVTQINKLFSPLFSPRPIMMMGSCAAALIAAMIYLPSIQTQPPHTTQDVVAAISAPPVKEQKAKAAQQEDIIRGEIVTTGRSEVQAEVPQAGTIIEPDAATETVQPPEPKIKPAQKPASGAAAQSGGITSVQDVLYQIRRDPAKIEAENRAREHKFIVGQRGTTETAPSALDQGKAVVQETGSETVQIPPKFETVTETVVVQPQSVEYEAVPTVFDTVAEASVSPDTSSSAPSIGSTAFAIAPPPTSVPVAGRDEIITSAVRQPTTPSAVAPEEAPAEVHDEIIVTSRSRKKGIFSSIGKSFKGKSKGKVKPEAISDIAVAESISGSKSAATAHKESYFTVFDGVSERVVKSTETTVSPTGEILCRVLIPAQYKTVTKRVVKTPARTEKVIVPAVTKDLIVKRANGAGGFIEVVEQVVIQEETVDYVIIPAVYETRSERVLIAPARDEWKPVSERIKPPKPQPRPQSGLLTAGDYDDVLNPDLYKVYLDKMLQGQLRGKDLPYVDADQRINIHIVDSSGNPVPMADIMLITSKGKEMFPLRTGADGRAYIYPNFDGLTSGVVVTVSVDGSRLVQKVLTKKLVKKGGDLNMSLSIKAQPVENIDLLLTIDATGSMGDEMRYLQSELKDIVGRVEAANPNLNVRTGLVVYRDRGDEYVVRTVPFTDDIEDFRKSLGEQRAAGGGDMPEAVHEAMDAGLEMEWREDAVKVNLFVADAPPHDRHIAQTWRAGLISRTKGIHIVPLAASGVDKTAEFLMRAMGQITGGRYLFLTDDSGIGNAHAEPTVDCYIVTRLDGLVTRTLNSLIKGERVEPDAGEVIRSVGNYRSGVCKLDQKGPNIEVQNAALWYEQ